MITPKMDKTLEFYGLSTDTKPTDITVGNGSVFIEMDTATKYMFSDSYWEAVTHDESDPEYSDTTSYWEGYIVQKNNLSYRCRNKCVGKDPESNITREWIALNEED